MLLLYLLYSSIFPLFLIPSIVLGEDLDRLEGKTLKKFIIGVCHFLFLILLMIFNIFLCYNSDTIEFLLNIYNKDDESGIEDNLDKIRTKSINLGNRSINVKIKLNKNIYIIDPKIEDNYKNIERYEFKPIFLENLRSDFIYIYFGNSAIKNMFSIASWKYPIKDEIVGVLKKISEMLFIGINAYFFTILIHIKDLSDYSEMKDYYAIINSKNYKYKIFKIAGYFEYYFSETRFYLYIIFYIIINLFILKRYYYGGFSNLNYLNLAKILSILFFSIKIIFCILNIVLFVLLVFSLILVINYIDSKEYINHPILLMIIILFHGIFNLVSFIILIKGALSHPRKLCSLLMSYNEDLKSLNESKEGNEKYVFIGERGKFHSLNEIVIPGLPRFLFYTLDDNDKNNSNVIYFRNDNDNYPVSKP